jgi:N-acetylmuramoyl-L-alanine amidase
MGPLYIAGRPFHVDTKYGFYNMYETGWDATKEVCVPEKPGYPTRCTGVGAYGEKAKNRAAKRYSARAPLRRYRLPAGGPMGQDPDLIKAAIPLEAAQAVIRQFVIHHDGLYNSSICWHVLQNERGLSCHFLVDNDGTIYQTLDLALCGFHGSEYNPISIGVELCNRGDAKKEPHYYDNVKRYPDRREVKAIKVQGSNVLSYDFTKKQYEAMADLAKALRKILPNLPVEYPQEAPGVQAWKLLRRNAYGDERYACWDYSGYIGHYHMTTRKWDPGPFDFKAFCEGLRGALCFPVWTGKKPDDGGRSIPEIPEDIDELIAGIEHLYKANEQRAEGGFFPVGPWGDARLWHGGVHLAGADKDPIYAPFPGRIVAARFGSQTSIGSADFVLLRHDMSVGQSSIRFFSLFMHLNDELKEAQPGPPWMTKDSWVKGIQGGARKGQVILLDEPVEAGEVIGRFGKAGPVVESDDLMKPQVHFEIFAGEELFHEFDPNPWVVIDGSASGRFCDLDEINHPIDADRSGTLSRRELVNFFEGASERQAMRFVVSYNVSEWTHEPSWEESLRLPAEFRTVKPDVIKAMIEDQITPFLWWTDVVATHARIPPDGFVYHYHPITFVRWINEKIIETASDPANQVQAISASDTDVVTGMSSDLGDGSDETGGDMVSDRDLGTDDGDREIDLHHLVEGFAGEPDPEF